MARYVRSLPGGGPWRILDECLAVYHNTQRAALGRSIGRDKCICPRALVLKTQRAQYEKKKDEQRQARRRENSNYETLRVYSRFLHSISAVTTTPMPREMSKAACRTGVGMQFADDGMDRHVTPAGVSKRQGAKDWCNTACPVKDTCLAYVTANEHPAGSWGGVWGGLDPWQRHGLELFVEKGRVHVRQYSGSAQDEDREVTR